MAGRPLGDVGASSRLPLPSVVAAVGLSVALLTAVAAAGCADGSQLLVELRTDYVPGTEFETVEVQLTGADGTSGSVASAPAAAGDDFLGGRLVAEFDSVKSGAHGVRVSLRSPAGGTLAERSVRLTLQDEYALTVVIARACGDILCPGPGDDADRTECLGGRCVTPQCLDGNDPSACGEPACSEDSDCPAGSGCLVPQCASGACLLGPGADSCGPGMRCDARGGCVPEDAGTADAGPPPRDAGRDVGTEDGGVLDAAPQPDAGLRPFLALYVPVDDHDGNFGGRAGLDMFCMETMPNPADFAGCGRVHALVSVTEADEIRDMPASYGYSTDKEVFWYDPRSREFRVRAADSFSSLHDGFIEVTQTDGTGVSNRPWTGSTPAGALDSHNCNGWTVNSGIYGRYGDPDSDTATWLSLANMFCGTGLAVRCICEFE